MGIEERARECFDGCLDGLRSTAELRGFGLGEEAVPRLVRSGALQRVTAGWFALGEDELPQVARLARLGQALERRYGGRAVASHQTALAMYGLPLVDVPLTLAHLTYRSRGKYRRRADHVVHPAPRRMGLPVDGPLPPAECVVQTAMAWGMRAFIVADDAALHRGLARTAELEASVEARRFAPAAPMLREGLKLLDARSESPGESLLRLRVVALGHPVQVQVETVAGPGRRYRLDLVLAGTRVALEFDGVGKYASVADIRAEKAREEALRTAGWVIVRFQWSDVFRPEGISHRIEWALAVHRRQLAG